MEWVDERAKVDMTHVKDRRKKNDDLMHEILRIMGLSLPGEEQYEGEDPMIEAIKRRFNKPQ